jgi:hypothetical protein
MTALQIIQLVGALQSMLAELHVVGHPQDAQLPQEHLERVHAAIDLAFAENEKEPAAPTPPAADQPEGVPSDEGAQTATAEPGADAAASGE